MTDIKPRIQSSSLSVFLSLSIPIAFALLSSCRPAGPPQQTEALPASSGISAQESGQITPTSSATQTPVYSPPYSTWVDPDLPPLLQERLSSLNDFTTSGSADSALIQFSAESGSPLGEWLYVAAAPFYSYTDEIKSADLRTCWKNGPTVGFPFDRILLTQTTEDALIHLFGQPSGDCLEIADASDLSQALWLHPAAVALIPFESVEPAYKILEVDNQDPLSKDFNRKTYALLAPFYFQAPFNIKPELDTQIDLSNFDQDKLSIIALTGVTAMVRDTAVIMEDKGLTYPAEDVRDILTSADITHINNEVPFAEDCPPPTSSQNSLRFCSDDRYLALLEDVGTDIVELSGDHFGDWGPEAMLHTLDLYRREGWLMYGGGENLQAGLAPVFLTHNGNRFAFIGCNGKSFDRYATATDTNPGASRCDFDWMVDEIQKLTAEGYLVIATMQHEEVDSFYSIALQQHDFRLLADAGAVIVSGSQAHHPQAFEYDGSSFIHYGLGNLFFDQWYLATRAPEIHANKDKSFIDLHYFYDGRYLGTRLIPLQFIDNARPRPMTAEEEVGFLEEVYQYSLWEGKWVYLFPAGFYSEVK